MRCAACGTEHSDSARFCGVCGAPVSSNCPACDAPVSPDLRFCTSCGAALDGLDRSSPTEVLEPAAERRRVSVLFVDLEDFTALAEALDPEEVRAVQSRYFETARSVIARFEGTVEKFIGDAVVAIWGAPVAHEDDADRAVRAALAMIHAIGRLGGAAARHRLSGRAGVTTGEAAVSIGSVGQGLVAGDLVNVASRLQGRASSGGVLVDEATRLLAPDAATYEAVGDLELKGRSSPVTAHLARAREGKPAAPSRGTHGGPFVGRDRELQELLELQEGVARDRRGRLVSVTGIAGIGKSRLAFELYRALDARTDPVAWHSGRAPAYGEGITFAAVAEMVRHRIRAPVSAAPELTRRQLSISLTELVRDDAERRWLEPRLAALLGDERLDAFERDDLFAAWRRYFERVSEASPAVFVFEDLQWADPALVDFIEHLATWARQHPILVVALARPELIDRRPTWGAGVGRFTAMHLEPLPDEAMRTLLELRAPELDAALVERILVRAGGVPLYAVEFARSLADDGADRLGVPGAEQPERRVAERDGAPAAARMAVPDSLHGLIAARIDALPAAERRLLLAAAVLGRRFRFDALLAIGAEPASVRQRVSALVRRELLIVDEPASDPSGTELAFLQDVVRDVAYRTLSRQGRRALHLAAARWLETLTDVDVAASLAGHLAAAHELAPDHPDATRIARRAVSALRRAAAAAIGRHVPQGALGHLEQALRLTDGPEQRAVVLDEAASAAGRLELAEQHLRELAALQLDAGRRRAAARTRARLASVLLTEQRNEPAIRELESALRAIRHVDRDAAGVELAAQLARARLLIGDDTGGLSWAERGLEAAHRLHLDAVAADLLVTRGTARVRLGDDAGLDDLQRAVEDAERCGSIGTELRAMNNLAWLTVADDPRTTSETARRAVELASTMGAGDLAAQLAEVAGAAALHTGEWQWALDAAEELFHPGTPLANRLNLAGMVGVVRALRGDPDPLAAVDAHEPLPADLDEQVSAGIRLARAWVAFTSGDLAGAARQADAAADGLLGIEQLDALAVAARSRLWAGDREAARQLLDRMEALGIRGRAADAQLATIRAGLVAIGEGGEGSRAYRVAAGAWRELALDGDLAMCLVDEVRVLGRAPDSETLALLDRLGANGLRRLIDGEGAPSG